MKEEIQKKIQVLTQQIKSPTEAVQDKKKVEIIAPNSLSDQIKTKQQGDIFMLLLNAVPAPYKLDSFLKIV
jgi:hypothetical protein